MSDADPTRRLVIAIIDFLQNQLASRNDLSLEDRDSLAIAVECLEMAYGLENSEFIQRRPLLDMFMQVACPVSIQNKLQAETFKQSGNAKMLQSQYGEADEDYSRAIELDRWNAMYFCNRAGARIKMQQYFEAISDCRQALLLNPDYAKAYARMGQSYALMNRPRRAARCYRQALELEPDNERYQNNLRVAEGQAAEQPGMEMGNLLQTIVSSIIGGGPTFPGSAGPFGGMPPPSFMIITDPHSRSQCPNEQTDNTQDASATTTNQEESHQNASSEEQSGNGNSDTSSEREPIHLRVLFGIPMLSSDAASNESEENQSPPGGTEDQSHDEELKRIGASQHPPGTATVNTDQQNIGNNSIQGSANAHEQPERKSEEEENKFHWSENIFSQFLEEDKSVKTNRPTDAQAQTGNKQQEDSTRPQEQTGPSTSQNTQSLKNPEGDSEKRPMINLSDISNFFRSFSRSDRESKNSKEKKIDQAKNIPPSSEKQNADDQSKVTDSDRNTTNQPQAQSGILTAPEEIKKEEESTTDSNTLLFGNKQMIADKSKDKSNSENKDDEQEKN
ncbi:hypothetical protein CDAR_482621 [Caerostris darwini]|uniref:SGTA homodimerisation domain-containing protein n=1 Tax=Caerostris darwini TaxID=1538125 RepID=A0AAV4Q3E2_9ARAC|nr:hypothetical protein CDAR_482621 [Caerostris darwini]